jgi:hypothetical protein
MLHFKCHVSDGPDSLLFVLLNDGAVRAGVIVPFSYYSKLPTYAD